MSESDPHERISELEERLDDLSRRLSVAEGDIGTLQNKAEHREDAVTGDVSPDRRNEAVLQSLKPGAKYQISTLARRFKEQTDIQKDKTAKRRAKNLIESRPEMEMVGTGIARYEPDQP